MPTTCDIITDGLTLADRLLANTRNVAVESFTAGDYCIGNFAGILADTLHIADSGQGYTIAGAVDTLHIADALSSSNAGGNAVHDRLRVGETIAGAPGVVLADTLTVADSLASFTGDRLADALHISDTLPNVQSFVSVAHDTLRLSDRLGSQVAAVLEDTLTFSDVLTDRSSSISVAHDTLTIADTLVSGGGGFNVLQDHLRITDAGTHSAAASNVALEHLYVADSLSSSDTPAGGAWASSTDTYAMSRYVHMPLAQIGVINGVLLAAGQDGFYVLAGATDAGDDIAAHAESGLMQIGVPEAKDVNARDTGDPKIKAASYCSMSYSGGLTRFGIGITRDGTETRYWYPFPARTATVPTTNRVKLGRGARSAFWRFLFENVDGAPFMVKEQRVQLDPISRRI